MFGRVVRRFPNWRVGSMLLAEELALIAIDPGSGRHALGTRDKLNAYLAGLLVVELHLDDRLDSRLLAAAGEVLAEAGPKTKAVLSAMSRDVDRRLGMGTWDAVIAGLVDADVVAPVSECLRPSNEGDRSGGEGRRGPAAAVGGRRRRSAECAHGVAVGDDWPGPAP
jgi:hypothetical protein